VAEEPENKNEEAQAEETETNAKSPIMKYVIMGGGGLVVVLIVAFATVFMLGGDSDQPAEAEAVETASDTPHAQTSLDHGSRFASDEDIIAEAESVLAADGDDLFMGEGGTVLDNITTNLEFLDYQPDEAEMIDGHTDTAANDSLGQVDWLEQEKTAITKREKDIAKRERELEKLHREVSLKLLTLEKAESTRINSLAKLYDGMDQRAVAQLMANLDDNTIVLILPRMKTKNASAVMSLLPPQRAAKLSKQMITIAEN